MVIRYIDAKTKKFVTLGTEGNIPVVIEYDPVTVHVAEDRVMVTQYGKVLGEMKYEDLLAHTSPAGSV